MEEFMGRRVHRCGKIERWVGKQWKEVNKNATSHTINGKRYAQKRIIMGAFNKNFDINNDKLHVLHINGNKKDKSFENLKVETLTERQARDAEMNLRAEIQSCLHDMVRKLEWKKRQREIKIEMDAFYLKEKDNIIFAL